MRIMTVAYKEERFLPKFIEYYNDKASEILVLNSTEPWFGEQTGVDNSAEIARKLGASVVEYNWPTEQDQRNAGLEYFGDGWVIVLDPDEFIDNKNWEKLVETLNNSPTEINAYVVKRQFTYWKNGWVAHPPRDYKMLVAVRSPAKFIDKRVINEGFGVAPIDLHHFSWARTDDEILNKITHYAHAHDFNVKEWYEDVWKRWQLGVTDVHPVTPETLHHFIPANPPPEIERLHLWP